MKDEFTKQFFDWLESKGLKNKDVGERLKNDHITISGWRSRGIPKSKRYACEAMMNELNQVQEPLNVIVMKPSHAQFNKWNRAALREGLTIEEWAFEGLEEMADQHFSQQTGVKYNLSQNTPPDISQGSRIIHTGLVSENEVEFNKDSEDRD